MPLLSPDTDQMSLPDQRGSIPQAQPEAPSSSGDLWGAAFRRSNIAGTLYEHAQHPEPETPGVPGFDPEVSVPKGYEPVADIFANARSADDVEWRRQQFDREQVDNHIIQAHGGWGVAASMAAGLVDPLTLASMAVPVAGETRLIQAGRLAATAGVTTAAQEAVMQQLEVSRTAKDSALNVAAGTVLGGVLGSLIRPRVGARAFESMADRYQGELHGDDLGEKVMGPIDGRQRIIPETEVSPVAPHPASMDAATAETERLRGVHESISEELAQQREGLVQSSADFVRGNDARAAERELTTHETALTAAQEAHANIPEPPAAADLKEPILERMEKEDQQSYGDEYDNKQYTKLRERAATKEARETAEQAKTDYAQQKTNAQEGIDAAQERVSRQQAEVQRLQASEQAFKDLKKHDAGIEKAAGEPGALAKLVGDEKAREELTKGLEPRQAPAAPAIPDVPQTMAEMHVNPEAESTAGAAAANTPTMRGEAIARGAETLAGTLGKVSPGARLMTSPSIESRKLIQELANIPETLTKNYDGIATASPIERELWKYDGVHNQGMTARGNLYRAYRERIAGEGGQPIVRGELYHEISKAMRRNDTHAIPEVAEAAKQTRAIEFDPLKARAIKNGLLPADVKPEGADSYLMRQYDTQKIKGNLTDWLQRLKTGFMEQGVEPAEAADIAHKASRNIMGSERGTMDWKTMDDIVPKSGQLKERTLKLPDTLLEPYLNNDIDHVAHSYLRSMAPEVEMTERFGSRDMKDRIGDVHDDYARMIERAPDDKAKAKLSDQMANDLRDLTGVRDRLYGIYGQPKDPGSFAVRAGRMLRTVNALRLLGAATLAHFPDAANAMMRYGLGNTFATVGKVLTSPEAFSLGRSEAKRMGAALDMSMNATASMLGDYATHSQYLEQRVGQYLARKFTILTGETPLITGVQSITSTMAQDTLVRTAQKLAAGKSVDSNLLARMAGAGIDKDMLARIAEQHEKFGATVNGLHFGMSDKWADTAAASAFESAVLRDAHSVTLRPGVGDTPLFMSTEWGKALRQFTTFGYAAQRSVVNPLMQGIAHGDPRAAQALFALASMGTLSYVSKQTAAGQPIEPFDSPRFALEVLDKSNLMGWTADLVFPALWMAGFKNLSRWSDRDPTETIGGPVVGTVFSTYAKQLPAKMLASAGIGEDENKGVSRADLHFMRRLMPGQNLWYARNHINSLEDAMGDAFNLPGKSNADRASETASLQ